MAAPSTALPARSSLQSGRPMMMAALVTLPPAEWPPAVRVVGQSVNSAADADSDPAGEEWVPH
jgi:hypothetical protein